MYRKSQLMKWAEHEADLIKDDCDEYAYECLKAALKVLKTIDRQGHSGYSIGVTMNLLNRLVEWKPLSEIKEDDFSGDCLTNVPHEDGGYISYHCSRYSALFKDVYPDGTVKYTDINRIICRDVETGFTFHYGDGVKQIKHLIPEITLPYMPSDNHYIVEMEQFKYDLNRKDDWDTEAIYDIIDPEGEVINVGKFYKFDENDNRIEIDEEEFNSRKKYVEERLKSDKNDYGKDR